MDSTHESSDRANASDLIQNKYIHLKISTAKPQNRRLWILRHYFHSPHPFTRRVHIEDGQSRQSSSPGHATLCLL
eukprot:Skav218242  [mRNA]  locus=scaffold4566:220945:221703:- [translate_table: standard]